VFEQEYIIWSRSAQAVIKLIASYAWNILNFFELQTYTKCMGQALVWAMWAE
jgi:hypothetical protein